MTVADANNLRFLVIRPTSNPVHAGSATVQAGLPSGLSRGENTLPRDGRRFDRRYLGRTGSPWMREHRCRVVATWRRGGPHNCLVEFDTGGLTVVPVRVLRAIHAENLSPVHERRRSVAVNSNTPSRARP